MNFLECIECGNPKVENQETGLCGSCGLARRKAERQAAKVKVVTPIKKVSASRAEEMKEYIKLKKQYLEMFPCCEVEDCHLKSVDIHHKAGRENERLTDANNFIALCRKHHIEFTEHSRKAINEGYSTSRTV